MRLFYYFKHPVTNEYLCKYFYQMKQITGKGKVKVQDKKRERKTA